MMDIMDVKKAYEFAIEKHKNQWRKGSGRPYVTHPIRVSKLVSRYYGNNILLIVGALLHDVIEDTNATESEIETMFGSEVLSLVLGVTSDEEEVKKQGKKLYLQNKMLNMTSLELSLKLLDRLDNVSDNPKEQYIMDTLDTMSFLLNSRPMTPIQQDIIDDIVAVCRTKMELE